jgi:hypothetical protein
MNAVPSIVTTLAALIATRPVKRSGRIPIAPPSSRSPIPGKSCGGTSNFAPKPAKSNAPRRRPSP